MAGRPEEASNPDAADRERDAATNFDRAAPTHVERASSAPLERDAPTDSKEGDPFTHLDLGASTHVERASTSDADPEATTGPDRDATADYDPDATERLRALAWCRGGEYGGGIPIDGRPQGRQTAPDHRLRDPGRAGRRRHGDRVQGAAPPARPPGRAEDDQGRRRCTTGRPGPLRGRGPRRRRHRPPQHRQDLRDRRARRPALLLARVPRGRQPGGADRRQTAAH